MNLLSAHIALRYIRSKKGSGFVTFISLFAMLAMALGVFALIVVLSVMNGFDYELKSRLLKAVPHAYVQTGKFDNGDSQQFLNILADSKLAHEKVLTGASPYIESIALLNGRGSPRPVTLRGVDLASFDSVSSIAQSLRGGKLERLESEKYQIAMGALLARQLGLTLGDKVTVTLPLVNLTPAGAFPRSRRFTIAALFETGSQADQSQAFISLRDAQRLYRKGDAIDGFTLEFDDLYKVPQYLNRLTSELAQKNISLQSRDWSQTQGSLFQAVKMEKTVIGILLSIIIAVAAFNIVTSLIMMVTEKRSQIAVLRTMGMERHAIVKIFLLQGTLTALLGIALGVVAGVLVATHVPEISQAAERFFGVQLFDPSVYFVAYLPSRWQLDDTLIIIVAAFAISLLATLYPAYRAGRVKPVEALNYF